MLRFDDVKIGTLPTRVAQAECSVSALVETLDGCMEGMSDFGRSVLATKPGGPLFVEFSVGGINTRVSLMDEAGGAIYSPDVPVSQISLCCDLVITVAPGESAPSPCFETLLDVLSSATGSTIIATAQRVFVKQDTRIEAMSHDYPSAIKSWCELIMRLLTAYGYVEPKVNGL